MSSRSCVILALLVLTMVLSALIQCDLIAASQSSNSQQLYRSLIRLQNIRNIDHENQQARSYELAANHFIELHPEEFA